MSRLRFASLSLILISLAVSGLASAANDTALRLTNVNGSNTAYVRVANHPDFALQTFTFEAWVQRVGDGYGFSTDPSGAAIFSKPQEGTSGSNISSWHLHWTNNGEIHFNLVHTPYSSGVYLLSSAVPSPLARHHLAVTFDGAEIRLYIDGALAGSTPWSLGTVHYGTDDVLIGADNFAFDYLRRFDGYIDDVRVWNHARSATQIATFMNCRLRGTEPGLVAYWPFDDGNLIDATGHGHDGTVGGIPASSVFAPLAPLEICTTGVGDDAGPSVAFDLRLAGGNPSSSGAELVLTLPRPADVRVAVHDLSGRTIRVLAEGPRAAGGHRLAWDGRRVDGSTAPAGMYFVSARCGEQRQTTRLVWLR